MDWIQVNGNWIKTPEKDPDIPPDTLEEDPDIPKNKSAEETMIIPPRKRLRKKQRLMPYTSSRKITSQSLIPLHSHQ